jgi:hypothetical protein
VFEISNDSLSIELHQCGVRQTKLTKGILKYFLDSKKGESVFDDNFNVFSMPRRGEGSAGVSAYGS